MKSDLLDLPELKGVEEILSQDEFIECFKQFIIDKYRDMDTDVYTGSITKASAVWGVSKTMVCNVMSKKRNPTEAMLKDIGYDQYTITFFTKRK